MDKDELNFLNQELSKIEGEITNLFDAEKD